MISNCKSKLRSPSLYDETHISSSFVTNHTLCWEEVSAWEADNKDSARCAGDERGVLPAVTSFNPPKKVYVIGYYLCSRFADDDSEEERGQVQMSSSD